MADMASAGIRAASKTPLFVWLAGMLGSRARGTGPEGVSVSAYMSVLQQDPGPDHAGPLPMPGFTSLRSVHARTVDTPEGWRLRRVWSDPVTFQAEARA